MNRIYDVLFENEEMQLRNFIISLLNHHKNNIIIYHKFLLISLVTNYIVVDEIIHCKDVYSCNGIMDNKEISNTSNIYVIFRL